ncbi:unnamed protein product [Brassica napus]|uniref:(rape) hypothetical protein n=1 Tax=Brassica napus TaxID=3708 RepID=A0A816ZLG9_BRANA|nr:unnamed protein product [Brassica napus]
MMLRTRRSSKRKRRGIDEKKNNNSLPATLLVDEDAKKKKDGLILTLPINEDVKKNIYNGSQKGIVHCGLQVLVGMWILCLGCKPEGILCEKGVVYDYFRGSVSNGMIFIVEFKHYAYTVRWDEEESRELWRNNYYEIVAELDREEEEKKIRTGCGDVKNNNDDLTTSHLVDEDVKKNNGLTSPPIHEDVKKKSNRLTPLPSGYDAPPSGDDAEKKKTVDEDVKNNNDDVTTPHPDDEVEAEERKTEDERMRHDDELEVEERKAEDERKQHADELESEERIAEAERKRQDEELEAWIAVEELGLQALYERNKEADMEELLSFCNQYHLGMKFKIMAKGLARTRGSVSNGRTFIVEFKHDAYTVRWDEERSRLTAHPVDEDVKKNYKCLTTPPHPVDEDVKKNNDSLTPHLQLMKM